MIGDALVGCDHGYLVEDLEFEVERLEGELSATEKKLYSLERALKRIASGESEHMARQIAVNALKGREDEG
ncbi:MAG: hypothetical protein ACXABY_01285 [Candidatus Thorarchaeota archaeon]|jgi:chaperonin cofactor prefoldin